jgi:hypothetical protein
MKLKNIMNEDGKASGDNVSMFVSSQNEITKDTY